MSTTPSRRFWYGSLIAVALAAAAAAGPTVANAFSWDDAYNIVDNPQIRDLGNIPSFFLEAWGAKADDAMSQGLNTNYWRPVALTSYAVDYALFGLNAAAFHATNTLLHIIASLLVFILGMRLFRTAPSGGDRFGFLLGALIFAVHPIHTEAFAVVTYRTDLLAGLAVLAGLVVWRGPAKARSRSAEWRAVALWVPLIYALGLGSKEMAVALPGALALMDLTSETRRPFTERAMRMVPLALVLVGYMAIRATLLTPSSFSYFAADAPASTIAWTMIGVFGLYARLLVAPWPLNPFYDWSILPPQEGPESAVVIWGLVALIGWFALSAYLWRRDRALAFGMLLFCIILIPVSQLVPVVVAAGERFLYAASAGPILVFGVVAARALRNPGRLPTLLSTTALGIVVLAFLGLSIQRDLDWRDDRTVLEANTRDWPQSFNAWFGLAQLYEKQGRFAEAVDIFERLDRPENAQRARAAAQR